MNFHFCIFSLSIPLKKYFSSLSFPHDLNIHFAQSQSEALYESSTFLLPLHISYCSFFPPIEIRLLYTSHSLSEDLAQMTDLHAPMRLPRQITRSSLFLCFEHNTSLLLYSHKSHSIIMFTEQRARA